MRRRADWRFSREAGVARPPTRAGKGVRAPAADRLMPLYGVVRRFRVAVPRPDCPCRARAGGWATPTPLRARRSARLRNNSALAGLKQVAQTTAPPLPIPSAASTGLTGTVRPRHGNSEPARRRASFGRKDGMAAFLAISTTFLSISAGFALKSISCKMSNSRIQFSDSGK